MEAEIRKLSRKGRAEDSDDEPVKKKPKKSYLEEEMAKYAKGRGVHKKQKMKDGKRAARDEGDVMAALDSFRSKLKTVLPDEAEGDEAGAGEAEDDDEEGAGAGAGLGEEDPGMEVDDDTGFLGHALHFPKGNEEEVMKAARDYEVIDPRQRGAQAKEEERERRRGLKLKPKDGGRGGEEILIFDTNSEFCNYFWRAFV